MLKCLCMKNMKYDNFVLISKYEISVTLDLYIVLQNMKKKKLKKKITCSKDWLVLFKKHLPRSKIYWFQTSRPPVILIVDYLMMCNFI